MNIDMVTPIHDMAIEFAKKCGLSDEETKDLGRFVSMVYLRGCSSSYEVMVKNLQGGDLPNNGKTIIPIT